MSKNDLKEIPTTKLEKIHYATLRLFKEREAANQREGREVKLSPSFLADIFKEADKSYKGEQEDLLGLHYYMAALKALPLERVRIIEMQQAQEIKRRRELKRQKLDAGNIEKEARAICQKSTSQA